MHKLVLVGCLLSAVAFAGDEKAMGAEKMGGEKMSAEKMMGWVPRKVTKEDKKGVEAMLVAHHMAWAEGNMAAAMATIDFPVYMMTDDAKGQVMAGTWDQATWEKMMAPAMKMMVEHKGEMKMVGKPKMTMFFLTDTMAVVSTTGKMQMGKATHDMRHTKIVIQKDGKWMLKGSMEGGWGGEDMTKMQMGAADMQDKPAGEMKAAAAPAPAK